MQLKPDTDKMESFRIARADLKADLELLAIFDSGQFRGRLASDMALHEASAAAKKAADKACSGTPRPPRKLGSEV